MNNWWYLENEAKIRTEEISYQINRNRLKRYSAKASFKLFYKKKLLYRLGGWLIDSGHYLQKKYDNYCQICESSKKLVQKKLYTKHT